MSVLVKSIYFDSPYPEYNKLPYYTIRTFLEFNKEVDFPFMTGSIKYMVPDEFRAENVEKGTLKIIRQPFVNDSGIFKSVIRIGKNGWYFVELLPDKTFQDLIVSPEEIDKDLYISKVNKCLLFSFYNAVSDTISVTGKVVDDEKGVYSKIKSNMDDLLLRNYYLRGCLAEKPTESGDNSKPRNLLGHNDAANYLGIRPKTLYNWISSGKIDVTKVGGINKFRKTALDNWLDSNTGGVHKKGPIKRHRRK